MEKVGPTILVLCETKLGQSSKIKSLLPEYKLFPRNVKQGKGGLIIGIKKNYFRSNLDVTSSEDKNILAVRVTVSDQLAYRIILAYGPQETESLEVSERKLYDRSVSGVTTLQ